MFNLHSLRVLLAAAMLGEGAPVTTQAANQLQPRSRASRSVMSLFHRGHHYPEQSSRQAMRAFRRQQGGPGIVLDPKTHQYVPRKD